ncbi:hypothetical protein V2E25_03270 [Mycoplasmopsis arginini]|uniref:Uncharacterized protein n=1 Tax=Mycoplasmopsis arginini TaxID=2094 RepID=A0ABZ2AJA0_MYCAR|nr:hypothetical protein [Mycoplasmopsis arginini]WVN21978.1 hypothetical protein V2E25_03270 [Mycoplasmopsis arginini]VEU81991.1 Uncharacterised protein [Mycoplasmopsis arginini]
MDNIQKKTINAQKLCKSQFFVGMIYLVLLVAFIGVLLAIYVSNKSTKGNWLVNPAYIIITILFGLSIISIIVTSIYGLKYAKEINDSKLHYYFLLSAIFIIPFVSFYCTIASATRMYNYFEKTKKQKKNKKQQA